MSDREEKLRAAREKLDKFRRKRSNMDSPSPVPSQTSQKVKWSDKKTIESLKYNFFLPSYCCGFRYITPKHSLHKVDLMTCSYLKNTVGLN